MTLYLVWSIVSVIICMIGLYIYVKKLSSNDDLGDKCFAWSALIVMIIGLLFIMIGVFDK